MEVKISEVIRMIDNGMSRKDISAHYGVPYTVMKKTVFNHPEIRNRRAKRNSISVTVIDDVVSFKGEEIVNN